jgi:hypothetical protein
MSTKATGDEGHSNDTVLVHIADYIIQVLIKEDVNAFAECNLLHELLMHKLPSVAAPLMQKKVSEVSRQLGEGKNINLIKAAGGVTTAKRISFRSNAQYSAFVQLFFQVVEEHPELLEPIDGEEIFEQFMIYCIYKFKEELEKFAGEIAEEKTALEHKHKIYVHRRGIEPEDVPTYADFIAERLDNMVAD